VKWINKKPERPHWEGPRGDVNWDLNVTVKRWWREGHRGGWDQGLLPTRAAGVVSVSRRLSTGVWSSQGIQPKKGNRNLDCILEPWGTTGGKVTDWLFRMIALVAVWWRIRRWGGEATWMGKPVGRQEAIYGGSHQRTRATSLRPRMKQRGHPQAYPSEGSWEQRVKS
jgi:hypothetical protein